MGWRKNGENTKLLIVLKLLLQHDGQVQRGATELGLASSTWRRLACIWRGVRIEMGQRVRSLDSDPRAAMDEMRSREALMGCREL